MQRTQKGYLVNNGPVRANWSVQLMQMSEEEGEWASIKSPKESAIESMRRVMTIKPHRGVVEPYSQIELTFVCHTKPPENPRACINNVMEDMNPGNEQPVYHSDENATDYFYSAAFTFKQTDYKLSIDLLARAVLPNIRLSTNYINFGSCSVHDRKDYNLKIENLNDEIPVDFVFNTVSQFKVEKPKGTILPLSKKGCTMTFRPANFGLFHDSMLITFIRGAYRVPIEVVGESLSMEKKTPASRGPGTTSKDFFVKKKYVQSASIAASPLISRKSNWLAETRNFGQTYTINDERALLVRTAGQRSTDFIRSLRSQRLGMKRNDRIERMGGKVPKNLDDMVEDVDLGMSRGLKQ